MNASRIQSHVAVVSGGGRGIGRAMVLELEQAGIHVVATAARATPQLDEETALDERNEVVAKFGSCDPVAGHA